MVCVSTNQYCFLLCTPKAVGAEIELAGSVHEEKLFELKTKSIVLDVSVNRPQEWEITARDSEEVCASMTPAFSPLWYLTMKDEIHVLYLHVCACHLMYIRHLWEDC